MRITIALIILALSAGTASSRDYTKTRGDTHDGDMLIQGTRSVLYALDAIFDLPPGGRVVVTNVYKSHDKDEDEAGDDHETTIGCYGAPEICSFLPDIIDIVMDDSDAWGCVSVPGGVECTHRPH